MRIKVQPYNVKCSLKNSTQTWGQTTSAQESWKRIKLSVMKYLLSQEKTAETL